MVSSPEVKVEFNDFDTHAFYPKNQAMPLPVNNRFEDIPTASTSTESLLSSNTTLKKNLVRSQDNLMPPFVPNPFMCFPLAPMMNNMKPNRKLSYGGSNGCNGMNTNNHVKRGMTGISSAYDNNSKKPTKNFYNKFNSPNEQNENTNILEIQCQVGENDVRVFKLKKYDDLFTSLQQFIDMNQIRPELIQPIANKVFTCLNKIFWLCNNKVGQYDQGYLLSLYRVWKKNKENIPKANHYHCHNHTQSVVVKDEVRNRQTKANANPNGKSSCNGKSNGNVIGSYSFNFYEELTEESIENKKKMNRSV